MHQHKVVVVELEAIVLLVLALHLYKEPLKLLQKEIIQLQLEGEVHQTLLETIQFLIQ